MVNIGICLTLKNTVSVSERNVNFFSDHCVVEFGNIISLILACSDPLLRQLKSYFSYDKIVFTTDISTAHYSHVLQRMSPLIVDHDVIYLIFGVTIW